MPSILLIILHIRRQEHLDVYKGRFEGVSMLAQNSEALENQAHLTQQPSRHVCDA